MKIVESPQAFEGSTRNGVTSNGYGAFQGAYRVYKPGAPQP